MALSQGKPLRVLPCGADGWIDWLELGGNVTDLPGKQGHSHARFFVVRQALCKEPQDGVVASADEHGTCQPSLAASSLGGPPQNRFHVD